MTNSFTAAQGDGIFSRFLKDTENLPPMSKQAAADEFYEKVKQSGYPIFENDSTAVLLYKGEAEQVLITGDMNLWDGFIEMEQIEGTDLFYYREQFEPDARLEYWMLFKEDGMWFTDPLNRYKQLNGLGELSELAMPQYQRHPILTDYEEGRKGGYEDVEELTVPAGILPYEHTVHVYLPKGYDPGNKYKAVYFQDGRDYIEFAAVPHIINRLIEEDKIEPVIGVFVTPPNLHQPKIPNRMTEYGMNDDYVKFFAEELTGIIDSLYSTEKDKDARLVVGDSYGGLISTYIPFRYPEVFGMGYSQSGYQSFQNGRMIQLFKNEEKKDIELFADIGTYETKVAANILPKDEINFLKGNRELQKVLEEKGYKYVYKEYNEGHTWGNWRRHLIDALIHFFGTEAGEQK